MALQWPSQTQLPILAEILLNGTWTDITRFVYVRDGITITGGAPDKSSKPQPAQLTLTLNNRDGRFTPRYTAGPYYPYLTRNTQIRLSVDVTSVSGARYSGFRFWGEVPDWPPLWNEPGTDIYVQVTASGPLRRLNQGGGQGSALVRYYATLAGQYVPVAYWPCEEDPQTSQIQTGQPGGNVMTITGSPVWKAVSDFNGSAPIGILNGSKWDGLTGQAAWTGDDIYATPGLQTWTCPPGITAVNCKVLGPGDDGANAIIGGGGGAGGGGGEFAQEAALAVTPGKSYQFTVQAGGSLTPQAFAGDAVTVTANNGRGTAGGTGSANTVHHDGGAGGTGSTSAGGGGGSSGGSAAAGNAGGNASGGTGGAGGAAVTGGGAGGAGGNVGAGGTAGAVPGGGGGGSGSVNLATRTGGSGGNGGAGQVEFVYTPPAVPLANVFRFILFVPAHGGNSGKVLARMKTGGTIAQLDVIYSTVSGVPKLQLKGYDSGAVLKFDSGAQTFPLLGLTFMVSAELTTSGSSVAWKLTGIVPGADDVFATYTGTVATASVGNVTEVIVAPNQDITKTAMGHFSVQYAVVPLQKVSKALHGHHTEMSVDRFLRLANEQALAAEPVWNETADHWGFEGWVSNCQGVQPSHSQFAAPAVDANYIRAGDKFTSSVNGATVFTVTSISAAFAGFIQVNFYPDAAVVMSSPATCTTVPAPGVQGWTATNGSVAQSGTQVANDDLTQLNAPANKWPSQGTHSLLLTAAGLTGDASTFEGGIANWTAAGNCTIAQTAAQAHGGTKSLALTSVAAGNMQAAHCTAANILTQGLPCAAGQVITASAWFRTAVSARSANIGVDFYDATGVAVGSTLRGADVTDSTTAWTQATASVTAPANAAFCRASLQVKAAGAASEVHYADDVLLNGYPSATAPAGTSGQPVTAGDIVSVHTDIYAPATLPAAYAGIKWYTSGGAACAHAEDDTADTAISAGAVVTLKARFTAPATAAFFAPTAGDHNADANGTLIYIDNVRVHPRMGPQTRRELKHFLEEIKDLDQGILKESRKLFGLGYRTRMSLINQAAKLTLDYAQRQITPPLQPVTDDYHTRNHITVHRHKGSKVTVTLENGVMSVREPPAGAGRYRRRIRAVAEADEQILALASHLLTLGTWNGERYPTITVNLIQSQMAALLPTAAEVEIGDFVKLVNLPFWTPNPTANQIVTGYTETLGPFEWTITWNCQPEDPFEVTAASLRRW